jgi:iron(III) transport system substrate-binding protein
MMPPRQHIAAVFLLIAAYTLTGCGPGAPPAGGASGAAGSSGGAAASSQATAAASAAGSPAFQSLLEAARTEASTGTLSLSITEPNQESTYRALMEAFNKRFGLNVRYQWQAHQQDYYTRLVTEAGAGRPTPDVLSGSAPNLLTLDNIGLLESYDWVGTFEQQLPAIGDPVERVLSSLKGKALAQFDTIYVIMYNTQLVAADQVPRTIDQMYAPRWDRKFVVNRSGGPLDTLGVAIGQDRALDIAAKLKANNAIFAAGTPGVVSAIASGQAALGIGNVAGSEKERAKGAPVEWLPLTDYIPILQQDLSVLKTARNPNLAKLFAAWMVTEGMSVQYQLEFMGRATDRGTPTFSRLQELAPNARYVEVKTDEDAEVRQSLSAAMTRLFVQ